jgi:branched-chain amino acid transport system ATP-binding protein
MSALLHVEDISKRFGGFAALDRVSFSLDQGERFGIIGPNGSGKTTLMNCIGGALYGDNGSIRFNGTDITRMPAWRRARMGIGRSFQVPRPFSSLSVVDNVCVAIEYAAGQSRHAKHAPRAQALAILERMHLARKTDEPAGSLTQVELRKLELARALATRPQILILDEVMAGLSAAEVDEMLDIVMDINKTGVTIIMIEHIMRAIMGFSSRMMCLDAGTIIAEGAPDAIVNNDAVRRIYLGA